MSIKIRLEIYKDAEDGRKKIKIEKQRIYKLWIKIELLARCRIGKQQTRKQHETIYK